jgi:hypothetical protein
MKKSFIIPAASGGGDNKVFLSHKSLGIISDKK